MYSEIHSRWPVLLTLPINTDDLDVDRRLTRVAVERLFAETRAAYLDLCETLDPSLLTVRSTATVIGGPAEGPAVTVSAGVVEVYPDELTFEARLRPESGGVTAARSRCVVSVASGVTVAMRDELIALAHAARHLH